MNKMILKTLVGSRAHGLERPDSDYDYRGVFVAPTSSILALGGKVDQIHWDEGEGENKVDDTAYELGKFLFMAMKSNATVLEVLHGPVMETTPEGVELKALFPYMWSSREVLEAFRGYSLNQRKKFLENKDGRAFKYAVAMLRVKFLGIELLRLGTITINVFESSKLDIIKDITRDVYLPNLLKDIKQETVKRGAIIDWDFTLNNELEKAYEANPNHSNNPDKLNEYLLKVRKTHWD